MSDTKITHDGRESCPEDTVCRVIGTMSGTSCDGLDVALLEVLSSGSEVRWLALKAFSYDEAMADRLRVLSGLTDAEALELESEWTLWVASALAHLVREWKREFGHIDLLGFSGHTWYHEPGGRGTRALGDGVLLQERLALPVVVDYRGADVAAGGQGAPLVPLFDSVVFADHGACLNLGGIANLTLLPQTEDDPVRAADLCGANLLLNRQARRLGKAFDRGGEDARRGVVQADAFARLASWSYLDRAWPKSLAAEDLASVHTVLDGVGDPSDAAATAVEWIAQCVANALPQPAEGQRTLMVTGGGAHHGFLMERLQARLPEGWRLVLPDGPWVDGKEAAAFAWLALRTARGLTTSLASVTGAAEDVCGGVLCGTFAAPGCIGDTTPT